MSPSHALDGVVSTLIDAKTEIRTNDKKMVIATNTSSSEVYILEEDEKPVIEKPEGDAALTMRREVLIQGFKNVQHAAAESVVKPEIASVFMYTKNNSIYFVATDAFRLAETRFLVESGTQKEEIEILIPIKNVLKIIRVLEGIPDTNVSLFARDGVVHIQTENVVDTNKQCKRVFS